MMAVNTDSKKRSYTDMLMANKDVYDAHKLHQSSESKISPAMYGYWFWNTFVGRKTETEIVDFVKTNETCRYALILPRLQKQMQESMLQNLCVTVTSVCFVHRQYVYLKESTKTLFVKYHDKYYIAFPNTYAIWNQKVVQLQPVLKSRTIVSFCNTRYRSCLPLEYMKNVTDASDVSGMLINNYAKIEPLHTRDPADQPPRIHLH